MDLFIKLLMLIIFFGVMIGIGFVKYGEEN